MLWFEFRLGWKYEVHVTENAMNTEMLNLTHPSIPLLLGFILVAALDLGPSPPPPPPSTSFLKIKLVNLKKNFFRRVRHII
jgi:hypothetical protein